MKKNPSVRIVITAVSLETIEETLSCMREYSFTETETVCISVARSKEIHQFHLMNGQNPVYIFSMQNGGRSL